MKDKIQKARKSLRDEGCGGKHILWRRSLTSKLLHHTERSKKLLSVVVQTAPEYSKHRLRVSSWPFSASSRDQKPVLKQEEHV